MNQVLFNKKRSGNPLQEAVVQMKREEQRDRANLAMTKDCVSVWRSVMENPEAFKLTERKAEELEEMIQKSAELEAGKGTRVEFDRGFGTVRVFGPGGEAIDL